MSSSSIQKKKSIKVSANKDLLKKNSNDPSKQLQGSLRLSKTNSSAFKNMRHNKYAYVQKTESEEEDAPKPMKCPTCQYNTTDKAIVNFPCNHGFCGACLSRYLITNDFVMLTNDPLIRIECPQCKLHDMTIKLEDMKKIIADTLQERKKPFSVKTECPVHNCQNEDYCVECKKWLCSQCKELFHNENYKGHTFIQNEPPKKNYCKFHPNKELNLYCTDCKTEICFMCLRNGQEHFNHINMTLEDFKNKTISDKSNFKYTTFEKFETNLFNIKNSFKEKFLNSYEQKKMYIDQIIDNLEKIKKDYINKKEEINNFIENYFQVIKSSYENYYQDLKEKDINLKTLNFINSVIKEINTVEFYSDYSEEIQQIADRFKHIDTANLFKFELKFFQHNMNLVKSFKPSKGQIYTCLQLENNDILTGSDDKTISVWNYDDLKLKWQLKEHKGTIFCLTKLNNGFFASGSGDSTIKIWDINNVVEEVEGFQPNINNNNKPDEIVAKSLQNKEVNELIKEVDKVENEPKKEEESKNPEENNISKKKNNGLLSELENEVNNNNEKKEEKKVTFDNNFAVNNDQSVLINTNNIECSVAKSTVINEENVKNSALKNQGFPIKKVVKSIATLKKHSKDVYTLAQIDDERLCSGAKDLTIIIWSLKDYTCIKELKGHTKSIGSIISPSSQIIISGGSDCKIYIWDLNEESQNANTYKPQVLKGHKNGVFSLALLSSGNIVSGSCDKTIKLWNWKEKECIHTFTGHTGYIWSVVQLGNNSNKIASASSDLNIKIWDTIGYKCVTSIKAHDLDITCLFVLKDGHIMSGSADKFAKIWEY